MKTKKKAGLPFQATRLSNFWPVCLTTGLIGPVAFRLPIARDLAFSAAIGYKVADRYAGLFVGVELRKANTRVLIVLNSCYMSVRSKPFLSTDCRKQMQGWCQQTELIMFY